MSRFKLPIILLILGTMLVVPGCAPAANPATAPTAALSTVVPTTAPTAAPSTVVPTSVATAAATKPPVTIKLDELSGSGQFGSAVLTDIGGGKTIVDITVRGEAPGALEPIHIHTGQCGPTLGDVAYLLDLLVDGKSTIQVNSSLASLMDGNHAINGHLSTESYSPPFIFCGNIPISAATAAGTVVPATAPGTVVPTTAPTTVPTPAPTSTSAITVPVTIKLNEETNSGQSGTAVLTDLGGGVTRVVVTVIGEQPGDLEPIHIHTGQCGPTLGDVAYLLNLLVDGKSTTDVHASLSSLLDGKHAVNGHLQTESLAPPFIFCGNIPAK